MFKNILKYEKDQCKSTDSFTNQQTLIQNKLSPMQNQQSFTELTLNYAQVSLRNQ